MKEKSLVTFLFKPNTPSNIPTLVDMHVIPNKVQDQHRIRICDKFATCNDESQQHLTYFTRKDTPKRDTLSLSRHEMHVQQCPASSILEVNAQCAGMAIQQRIHQNKKNQSAYNTKNQCVNEIASTPQNTHPLGDTLFWDFQGVSGRSPNSRWTLNVWGRMRL